MLGKNQLNIKRKKSKSSKKIQKLIDKNKKDGKKVEVEEKDLKKVLKDINEDYDNELEMLNNQENQIKFLLNLIDVNNQKNIFYILIFSLFLQCQMRNNMKRFLYIFIYFIYFLEFQFYFQLK